MNTRCQSPVVPLLLAAVVAADPDPLGPVNRGDDERALWDEEEGDDDRLAELDEDDLALSLTFLVHVMK